MASTTFRYALATPGRVSAKVFDAAGRLVRDLDAGAWRAAGEHALTGEGRDDAGRHVAPGVYFLRLESGASREARRVVLVR